MNILKKRMLSRPSGFLAMAVSAVLAATLQAAEVTADMALAAAGAWSAENRTLSGAMGSPVSVKERRSDKGALLWYEVAMSGGGGVAVAPDTGIEPIIAVFRDCNGEIPEGHPLCTMLERDMRERLTATKKDRNPLRKGAVAAGAVDDRMENIKMRAGAKWKRLAGASGSKKAEETRAMKGSSGRKKAVSSSGEVLPDKFWSFFYGWSHGKLDHWNQNGWNCYVFLESLYDKYTPNHYPCGCVATAGAALLQFYGITKAPKVTRTCHVDGVPQNLTTKGIDYDWSLVDSLYWYEDVELDDAQKDLFGRVTYDMGVCLAMSYKSGGSSADIYSLAKALRNDFGFADARYVQDISAEQYEKLIYNQVRCESPVVLGLGGGEKAADPAGSGHAVLAVGCGEDNSGTVYTRLFMGWGGTGDAWYALPEVEGFNLIDDVITMIEDSYSAVPICARIVTTAGDDVAFESVAIDGWSFGETTANGFFSAKYYDTSAATLTVDCRGVSRSASVGSGLSSIKDLYTASELAALLPATVSLTVAPLSGELKVYNSPIDARVAALTQGKALFVLSGADWCPFCGIVKRYIKSLGSAFTDRFVLYYCNNDNDAYGMAWGSPDYGVFDPRIFDYTRGWAESNGMLAFDGGGVEERVQAVLDSGWSAWNERNGAPVEVALFGAEGLVSPSQYAVCATFSDGVQALLAHGAAWAVSLGSAAVISADGMLTPVADCTGSVTIRASATLWGQTYTRTKTVRIIDSASITSLSISGPALIDLYDETGGQYRAFAICQDGTTVEVSPEWSVSGDDIDYARMSARGELFFDYDTYTVYQCAIATITAVYGGFTATAQTELFGPGYVEIDQYDIPQNAVWPGCTFSVTPRTVRWWRHGVLEEPTSDFSGVVFSWELSCSGDKWYSGDGTTVTVPSEAFSTDGECTLVISAKPDRERCYGPQGHWLSPHFCDAKPQMATIRFDANGGVSSFTSMKCVIGKPIAFLPELSRPEKGYEGGYWSTAKDDDGEYVDESFVVPAAGMTLYAQWNLVWYWISFNANGGKGWMSEQWLKYGESDSLYENEFEKKGHWFAGWALSPDGPVVFRDRQNVKNLLDEYGEVILYAVWKKTVTYTVKFNANGGTLPKGKKMAAQTMVCDFAAKLTKNAFTRKGHVFAGWATSKANAKKGKIAYTNAQKVSNLRTDGGTTRLYAVWAKKTYKVAFYANGGTGRMADQSFTYGKAKKLSANKFKAPKGKKFVGWAKSKSAAKKGKVTYKNKQKVKSLLTTGKTVKLYAVWKKK